MRELLLCSLFLLLWDGLRGRWMLGIGELADV